MVTQHDTQGGIFAIISLGLLALGTWISTHNELLHGIASIAATAAAIVSIILSIRKRKSSEGR